MPGTLVNLFDDLVHQAIGIGIDIVILHLERCTAFVGRYPVGTDRTSRPSTYLIAVLERDLRDKVRRFRFLQRQARSAANLLQTHNA